MTAWFVAGLGNPGERYSETRHNLGARVVARLADRLGTRLRKVRFLPIEAGEVVVNGERVWLARSQTFMNVSGPSYASLARKRGVDPDRVVAVHDEIDLAFGSLKVKRGGSTAGHRGLDSLAQALRTKDFHRVRIGVGRPAGQKDPADHVLEPFAKAEREEVDVLVEEAAEAVLTLVTDGLAAAQDRHNRVGPAK
ncbi:MAG: aminoacyl-tRNA hydrolase [Actinomycetota bacterium]